MKNVTYYTGKLVCCTPKAEKINILLATKTKTELIKNGCRLPEKSQRHQGYNTWSVAPENFPQTLTKLLAHEQPEIFVFVEEDGVKKRVIVKVA